MIDDLLLDDSTTDRLLLDDSTGDVLLLNGSTTASVGGGLYDYLINQGSITGIVSERIYPYRIPEKPQLPAIYYERQTLNPLQHLTGSSAYTVSLYRLSAVARSYDQAKSIARSLRRVLHGYSGEWGAVTIHSVFMESTQDDYQVSQSDKAYYRTTCEFSIAYKESRWAS